jgi:hypothetical protein
VWTGLSWLRIRSKGGVYEYGNERTSSVIVGNFLANRATISFLKSLQNVVVS